MTLGKLITIMGSGLVGALAYTWSDTFWFSAVEGEGICLLQPLFTAVVFWLILNGNPLQRASQRPLAGSDCLPDRTFHRCALAELIVYSGHCTGVLL